MFIIMVKYKKPIEEVEKELQAHIQFLDQYYDQNKFICSGRRNPRVGGVILCNAKDAQEVEAIIKEDPFYIHEIADYELIEFAPTKYVEGFEQFIK